MADSPSARSQRSVGLEAVEERTETSESSRSLAWRNWGWVKTLAFSEHQNSWDLWMFIPLKMVLIGIDPWPILKSGILWDKKKDLMGYLVDL